jgi:hypothetical protein
MIAPVDTSTARAAQVQSTDSAIPGPTARRCSPEEYALHGNSTDDPALLLCKTASRSAAKRRTFGPAPGLAAARKLRAAMISGALGLGFALRIAGTACAALAEEALTRRCRDFKPPIIASLALTSRRKAGHCEQQTGGKRYDHFHDSTPGSGSLHTRAIPDADGVEMASSRALTD